MLTRAARTVGVGRTAATLARPRLVQQQTRLYSSANHGGSSVTTTALASIAFFAAAAVAYYYDAQVTTPFEPKFTIRIRGKDYTYTRKSDQEIEKILTQNEDSVKLERPGNPVARWDRNSVASNEPCEDRSAVDVVARERGLKEVAKGVDGPREAGDRDIDLFSIMDGHAGDATAKLLAKALHPTISLSLAGLQAQSAAKSAWNPLSWFGEGGWAPATVASTLQKA